MRMVEHAGARGQHTGLGRLARAAGAVSGATALAVASLVGVQLSEAGSAGATAPSPVCSGSTCTVTYSPGVGQTFTVPKAVSLLSLAVWGGAGGSADRTVGTLSSPTPGGKGAEVTATLSVSAGSTLAVDVGGMGGYGYDGGGGGGGANGGGAGAQPSVASSGGGGGGASDVSSNGTRLVVAGGGGGAGGASQDDCLGGRVAGGAGGNAGQVGHARTTAGSGGGGGAGTSAAGAGGAGGSTTDTTCTAAGAAGNPGTGADGGSGATASLVFGGGGGGGGGGYFGGGAGGDGAQRTVTSSFDVLYGQPSGGGGGGSSYGAGAGITNYVLHNVTTTGNTGGGKVEIAYTDPVSGGTGVSVTTLLDTAVSIPSATLENGVSVPTGSGETLEVRAPSTPGHGTATVTTSGITYTPAAGYAGPDSFTYEVANTTGTGYVTLTVAVTVQEPPAITSAAQASFVVGVADSFGVTDTGYPAPTVTESGALPQGVSWTGGTHTLSGTPQTGTEGAYPLTFAATNGVSPQASQAFTLVVDTVPAARRTAVPPGAPTLTTATPGTGEVHLAWTAPATAAAGAITGYEVCDSTTAASVTTCTTLTTAGTATSFTLSGLTDGTTYSFAVRAKDASGYGPLSNVKTATPSSAPTATRITGPTPDATAAAELERAFPPATGSCPSSRSVVLATTAEYDDALSSQFLAQSLSTGTLLTPTESLSAVTEAALKAEGIQKVVVVGGPLAITTSVVAQIEALPAYACGGTAPSGNVSVTRIYGATQYATAAAVAERVGSAPTLSFPGAYQGTDPAGGTGRYNDTAGQGTAAPAAPEPTAILASGVEFQDAEAASVLSYRTKLPLLLTPATSLSPTAVGAMKTLGVRQVVLMGGTLAVASTVEEALVKIGVSVLRVAGQDGTDTAAMLARFEAGVTTAGLGWTPGHRVLLARGTGFTDGIAGAVFDSPLNTATGPEGSARPLLLTESPTTPGSFLSAFLTATGKKGIDGQAAKTVTSFSVLGGPLALSTAALAAMEADLGA